MELFDHFVDCPKFGGRRPAPACIHYDRYKACRRKCKSIEAYTKEHPDYQDIVERHYARKEGNFVQETLFGSLPAKHSGKSVPDHELACHICPFVGKSKRGLSVHLRRTHKILKRKKS